MDVTTLHSTPCSGRWTRSTTMTSTSLTSPAPPSPKAGRGSLGTTFTLVSKVPSLGMFCTTSSRGGASKVVKTFW
uniref:Uncharacterized protein n=1 Tax=Brassica campestris TaxID=3711 RepID=A0A3P5YXG3_BRACM|nr:unnamed protein product [Brassica rapa]